jgi:hypothetical protein
MGSIAQFRTFGPFFSGGNLVASVHVYHYLAGTTTLKDAYVDRAKNTTAAQPLVADSQGIASAFFDGLYKITVKTSDDATTLYTWDNFDCTVTQQRLEGSLSWNPGNLVDGAGETSTSMTVTGAAFGDYVLVSAPYSTQGMLVTGYISASDTVSIRIQNETTGAIDLASGTWTVRVLKA